MPDLNFIRAEIERVRVQVGPSGRRIQFSHKLLGCVSLLEDLRG
jgi:hypothetical protein